METKNEWDILASKYETVFQPRFKPMYQHMAKIALANPHHKLVDFATGPGEPSRSIVEKLISDGNTENTVLILSDSSEGMLKVAKSKISPLLDSVKGLDVKFEYTEAFCVSPSMSNLDTLLVSLGLMYMSNLDSLLQEFSKSLLPQGRVISSHWPHPSKVPTLRILKQTYRKINEGIIPPVEYFADHDATFNLHDRKKVEGLFHNNGYEIASYDTISLPMKFNTVWDLLEFSADVIPNMEDKREAAIREAEILVGLELGVSAEVVRSGPFTLMNEVVVVVANKNQI